jgi:hypothetical protein
MMRTTWPLFTDDYGELVLDFNSVSLAACRGYIDIMKRLIQHGGSVTTRVLRTAAECGRLDCVKFLLSWAYEHDVGKFVDGSTMREGLGRVLYAASLAWRDEIVKALLESEDFGQVAMNRSFVAHSCS